MATPFKLKRSAITGKRPGENDLQIGELAINFYDGHLFAQRDTQGVGIGTTATLLTPWVENYGGGSINYNGIVTATTYHGDQVIGNPAGGFKSGAFTINNTDHTKDLINELNFILGKLIPPAPTTFNGLALSIQTNGGTRRLCAGFTPTNNTGGSAPVAGQQYARNTDSTVSTGTINDVGPGDNGTVTGFVNATNVGSITMTTNVDNGTNGALVISDNKDASLSTRDADIDAEFYQVYDVRLLNAASPDGFNKAHINHGSANTQDVFWYEDPSTVSAPVISFGSVTVPSPGVTTHSSGVPHYTNSASNAFTYVLTVTNASGDMYTQNTFLTQGGGDGGNAFANSGNKSYTNFAGGTNPPTQNYGVGTGVTTLISSIPRNNLHTTITSNHFSRYDATTPYGTHPNQRISFSTPMNIMSGSHGSKILETSISNTAGNGNNGTRVPALSATDNPDQTGASYAWNVASTVATYEAVVRGGVLRHDQTNYSSGYLPVGPDYSSGRSGVQYFQIQLITPNVSTFNISYTGSVDGCWVCMPDNSTWTTSLSDTNGWADMFNEYVGSGVPRNVDPGCAYGGVMDNNGGTFTCTFGTESSSNDTNNRILIRWKLTAGQSITAMSFTST